MVFQEFMESKYSAEERATELYKLLLQIGNYTELTISQEAKALIDARTDPSKMLEQGIRRFLSSFYVPIRNYVPAHGTLNLTILQATGSVAFSAGDKLLASNGAQYELTSSGVTVQGGSLALTLRQGSSVSLTGTFDRFISFEASTIDMDSIELTVAGVSIPQVDSPANGFVPFLFDGVVYLAVFKGALIPKLQGQPYTVTYRVCDGVNGNVDTNSFSAFVFEVKDSNFKPVKYLLTNSAIDNGASEPSLGELRDLLRYWHHTKNVLTRPADYRNWFLVQSEVGDCLAWGDTEEILMGTRTLTDLTGCVNICLLSPAGTVVSAANRTELFKRVLGYKDVTYLRYVDPTFVQHAFEVRYVGTDSDSLFLADALAYITGLYTLATVRENGESLFDALDVGAVTKVLGNHSTNPQGLEIIPYFYYQASIAQGATSFSMSFPSPKNLKRGYTRYKFETLNQAGVVTDTTNYTELMTSAAIASIIDSTGTQRGTHNYDTNTVTLTPGSAFPLGRMKVYGEVLNRSYIDTGAFRSARTLGEVMFTKVTPTY